MSDRILLAIFRVGITRPGLVMTIALALGLLGLFALKVPLDLSFAGVMDREHPEVARYFDASKRLGLGGLLPILVEGPEEQLDLAVVDLTLALDDLDIVRSVEGRPPREWLLANAPWLVDAASFELWLAYAEGGPDRPPLEELEEALRGFADKLAPAAPEGVRLVVVTLLQDSFELALDSDQFPRVRAAARQALAPYGAAARFSGMAAIITQEQEATLERMRWLAPISFLLVLVLLQRVEPRPLMLVSVGLPMLLSIGCTLALIGSIAGELSIMESVFGVLVFGLGVDFGIHLLLRLREEQGRGHDFGAALELTIRGTGHGITAGAATTAGAFLILALAPDPVFRRLGLAGGIGLAMCLAFLLIMLPAQWTLLERRQPADARPVRPMSLGGLAQLARLASRAPLATLVVASGVLFSSALAIPQLRYETNLEHVFSREIDAVTTARRIHELFGVDPAPWVTEVDDLEEARRISAAFEAEAIFERSESLASLLRPDRAARAERLAERVPAIARFARESELAWAGARTSEAESARAAILPLEALLRAHTLGPPTRESLPKVFANRLVGPDGDLLVYAFVANPALDSAVAARERRAAQAIHPGATSMNVIYEALIGTDRPWMPPLVALVMAFVAAVLYLDFRSVKLALLALVPVTAAGIATLGVLSAFDFAFNTVTLVAIPLLLGLGVDDGIHIVHRMREEPDRRIYEVVGSVARSIAMTTLTTCASVSTLVFTRHPGIESVAILLLVGLPLCLLASVTLLPACAVLLRVRPRSEVAVDSLT